jgi:tetratricopeptide (TPR) repeat protein
VLDALRVALSAYVDEAMVSAYGEHWDDLVAEEDAKRRKDGRRFPVRKNDLAVMLKVLIHRRIEPWSSMREYQRLRAFASEILTLRNLHAHGDDCDDEANRLIDTAGRMLTLLAISVPRELQPLPLDLARIPGGEGSVHLSAPQPSTSRWNAEIARLGEVGEQVSTIGSKATQLGATLSTAISDELAALDPQAPDFDTFRRTLKPRMLSTGEEAVGLLAELERIELAGTEPKDPALALLFLLTRHVLTTESVGNCITVYWADLMAQQDDALDRYSQRFNETDVAEVESEHALEVEASRTDRDFTEDPDYRRLGERFAEVDRLVGAMGSGNFSQAIQQVASQLGEANHLANVALAIASMDAAWASKDENNRWTHEALQHLKEANERLRFEAAMEPGTYNEEALVRGLRLEGEAYNDIGQPDAALQAFARAAEIVDRYPSADPDLPPE